MFRHSLFFKTTGEATSAEKFIKAWFDLVDIYQSNDGETDTIEVRFFTERKLSERNQGFVVQNTWPATYALNCED